MSTEPVSTFLISYFPLICECISKFDRTSLFQPGDEKTDQINRYIEQLRVEFEPRSQLSAATGCIWIRKSPDSDDPCPVLILERAKAIGRDLQVWSDHKPEEWFDVEIAQLGDRYALALMPRFEKSIARQKVAALIDLEEVFQSDKYQILFSPLHFVSLTSNAFNSIKHSIGKKITVFVIDKEYVHPERPFDFRESDLFELGTFDVAPPDSRNKSYVISMLEDEDAVQ